MAFLSVNNDSVVRYAARLERMSRTSLPAVVRQTLNSAAFDVKKKTMPEEVSRTFIRRKPTFFSAKSKVIMANGNDINSMQSEVGFTGREQAVEDLEAQEKGGTISGRAFIPLAAARTSSNWNKSVRSAMRLAAISGSIVDSKNAKGKNDAEKFTKSAIHAGKGGFVIGNRTNQKGNKYLYRIASIKRTKKKMGNTVIKSVALYSVRKGKKVKPEATHFMERASMTSAAKMERMFITNARKKLNAL